MKNDNLPVKAALLPDSFNRTGLVLIASSIVFAIVFKFSKPEIAFDKRIILSIIILGLFFICFAKDKIENELKDNARNKALKFAFVLGVWHILLNPLNELIFGDEHLITSAQNLIILMMLFYLIIYYGTTLNITWLNLFKRN